MAGGKGRMTAALAADILGINRTREGDVSPMVRALGLLPALNAPEDERRRVAGAWALRNWRSYQAECTARRDARGPVPALAKAVRALVFEVEAAGGRMPGDVRAMADAARAVKDRDPALADAAADFLGSVEGHDALLVQPDVARAAESLRDLLPGPSAAPGR